MAHLRMGRALERDSELWDIGYRTVDTVTVGRVRVCAYSCDLGQQVSRGSKVRNEDGLTAASGLMFCAQLRSNEMKNSC